MKTLYVISSSAAILILSACSLQVSSEQRQDQLAMPVESRPMSEEKFVIRLDAETAERDRDVCAGWKYEVARLSEDMALMREVDVGEWGRSCYQYACSAVGKSRVEGHPYSIEVNAGGWMALKSEDTSQVRYLITEKQVAGFLATCDCCD